MFDKLVAAGHDSPSIRMQMASLAKGAGKMPDVVTHLSEAIRLNPQAGGIYYKLIAVLDKMGKVREAFDWRRKLLKIDQMNVKLVDALLEKAKAMAESAA